jgi:hypothetical protein
MKIFHGTNNAKISRPTTLTLGVFDGLHLGHQRIMQTVVSRAEATETIPTAITFDPHPRAVLHPKTRRRCCKPSISGSPHLNFSASNRQSSFVLQEISPHGKPKTFCAKRFTRDCGRKKFIWAKVLNSAEIAAATLNFSKNECGIRLFC